MEKRNVFDRRQIKLEDVVRGDYIPFLGGRPTRTTTIGEDDIANLVIALNTTASIDEFLRTV